MSVVASTPAHPRVTDAASLILTRRNLERLKKALRRERARARCRHWSYDHTRYMALAESVRRHEAALAEPILEEFA